MTGYGAKQAVRDLLLAFVVVSLAYWAVTAYRGRFGAAPAATDQLPPAGAAARVVAGYFHGSFRCVNCRKIEDWSRTTVATEFAKELANGILAWREVNFDEPEHAHYRTDFGLTSQSLVLMAMKDGKVASWKVLPEVWTLLGDEAAFRRYVATETRTFLEAAKP